MSSITAGYEHFVEKLASPQSTKTIYDRLDMGALGLAGETGEVVDVIKKILFHGMELDVGSRDKLKNELGDVLWYVTFLIQSLGWTVEEVILDNIAKLQKRYPGGKFDYEAFMAKERGGE